MLGRADDVLVTGGEKVAPAAVADALAEHPAVAEAAVVGVADPEWGQRVVAVVVLRAGSRADAGRGQAARRRAGVAGGGAAGAAGGRRAAAAGLRQARPAGAAAGAAVTTVGQWIEGARPRTLPAAVAPVLVGTGAAAAAGDARPGPRAARAGRLAGPAGRGQLRQRLQRRDPRHGRRAGRAAAAGRLGGEQPGRGEAGRAGRVRGGRGGRAGAGRADRPGGCSRSARPRCWRPGSTPAAPDRTATARSASSRCSSSSAWSPPSGPRTCRWSG